MADELIFYTNPMSRGRIIRWMLEEVGAPYDTVVLDYASTMKKYINVLVHEGASDLHLSAGVHPTIRVSGSLAPMLKEPILTPDDTTGFVKELLSKEQLQRFMAEQGIEMRLT